MTFEKNCCVSYSKTLNPTFPHTTIVWTDRQTMRYWPQRCQTFFYIHLAIITDIKTIFKILKAFLGQRYGDRSLLSDIDEQEFNLISNEIDSELLEHFYELDENYIENKQYRLKNVKTILETLKVLYIFFIYEVVVFN